MLIEVQATLRLGDILVPLIFMSDGTHFSNFAGNKKEQRVYMTISNLSSKIRQVPAMHTVVMVALLLIPIKNCNIAPKRLDEQWQTILEVLNEVLCGYCSLSPLNTIPIPRAGSTTFSVQMVTSGVANQF